MHNIHSDMRDVTHQTRVKIGFLPEYEQWKTETATFTAHELTINGHPVMEDWEDGYMKTLAEIATRNNGIVLELGYGMGISARYIQEKVITEHIIVEANDDVYRTLETFATKAKRAVRPLHGFWQEKIAALPDNSVDGILFDTYPLTEREIHKNHFDFFPEAYRVLKPGGVLTYYSDEIDDYSDEHLDALQAAGFSNINHEVCKVTPPHDCEYWKSPTILAPIVTK